MNKAVLLAFASLALSSCRGAGDEPGKGGRLVIYSSHPEEQLRCVVAEYRDRTGEDALIVRGGTGQLLEKLRKEQPAPAADVFWGGGAESLEANSDLFEPYVSQAFLPDRPIPRGQAWTAFTVLPMVIVYNAKLVPPDRAPGTWKDALDPYFAGSVAYTDPEISGSAYTVLRTLELALSGDGSEAGRAAADASLAKALGRRLLVDSKEVVRVVASGECLVGFTYEYAAMELAAIGSDIRLVYPSDGTSAVPDGIALVKGSKEAGKARAFIDFALGADVAKVIAGKFGRRSARKDSPTPPGLPPLESLRILPYDIQEAASGKKATIRRFREAMSAVSGQEGDISGM